MIREVAQPGTRYLHGAVAASDKNRKEYEKRINRVLDYIQAHRAEELTLETLASEAAFSPFHFHRVFKIMTGENLREFIQRIRLETAASHLTLRPDADVLEIALENGFASASGFARAFKDRFGMSATAWRSGGAEEWRKAGQALRNPGQVMRKPGKAALPDCPQGEEVAGLIRDESNLEEIMNANVTVKTLPTYHVAYLRTVGPYGPAGTIRDVWDRLAQWAQARDLWTPDRITLGISYDDPKVTEPAKCRYDAAIVITPDFKADNGVNVTDVTGGKYATLPFTGTATEIGAAYDRLFAWLPQSGYTPEHRPCFELYTGEPYNPTTGTFTCDICLPVRPL